MTTLSKEQVRISRRMSQVLRHRPEAAGLTLDANGWVSVADLLAALHIDRAALDVVVAGNDKSRFAVAAGPDGVERIRASQGHSSRVGIDLALDPADPPATLFHGTPRHNAVPIKQDGLRPGSRQHVHLSPDATTATAVGRRRSPDVVIFKVDTAAMAQAGHVFYRSENGVWLTAAVPPAYLDEHSR
ncbi:RNA 2'-phosphotransferase [Actinoplanes sp. TFC3]|uniref:RNA 2'-phosphotransferase n=1 Tax=Actinoplanes sp. TFC3 TaxID=1710355 RepID=UPI00082D3049|nr:RNA 2'-phosphotransferase [Actinoplanes sp. TFC3]